MAIPATREDFIQWCLRKLGAPIIDINLTTEQINDRVDQSVAYWQDFHMEGTQLTYYAYAVQSADITNQYFTLPSNVIGVGRLFDVASTFGSTDIFSITYQVALSEMWNLTSIPVAPYWMALQNIQQLQQVLVGQKPIRYSRMDNILHIDMDWNMIAAGNYLVVEAYIVNDPANLPLIWADSWLQKYACAQIKKNWGEVLCKYTEMPLTGGMKLNGQRILQEGIDEIAALEHEMITSWSTPLGCLIG